MSIDELIDDAIWKDVADELIVKFVSKSITFGFNNSPEDKETLGKYILSERRRKYHEGKKSYDEDLKRQLQVMTDWFDAPYSDDPNDLDESAAIIANSKLLLKS